MVVGGRRLADAAEHDAVANGEEDVVDTWVEGDALVELVYCMCFAVAAQLTCLGAGLAVKIEYAAVPQHVVQQDEPPLFHLGEEQGVVEVVVFFVGIDEGKADTVG